MYSCCCINVLDGAGRAAAFACGERGDGKGHVMCLVARKLVTDRARRAATGNGFSLCRILAAERHEAAPVRGTEWPQAFSSTAQYEPERLSRFAQLLR